MSDATTYLAQLKTQIVGILTKTFPMCCVLNDDNIGEVSYKNIMHGVVLYDETLNVLLQAERANHKDGKKTLGVTHGYFVMTGVEMSVGISFKSLLYEEVMKYLLTTSVNLSKEERDIVTNSNSRTSMSLFMSMYSAYIGGQIKGKSLQPKVQARKCC